MCDREMSLDEWCAKLIKTHRVNLELNELKTKAEQIPVDAVVMPKIADIAEKALRQWKLHIEENEQADLEDINHLEALEWKKLNAELQSIKSNFSV